LQTDTGTYTTKGQNIVYYFAKAKGQLVVKYVDEAGNEIQQPILSEDKVGTNYASTHPNSIGDFDFYKVDGNSTGKYEREKQLVTYIYKKATGQIIVKYVDENYLQLSR
ncbi:MucBP domain-containing protein, partial [Mammaliicoccus sciuri]|uniref:MucBP domain-containing protein n=1 Tax=Mammaliicoccus sciuri TaxID=1296 RepID=UPI00226EFAE0